MSNTKPLTTGAGQNFAWDINLPEGSVINTANSMLTYRMKFVFNCKNTTMGADGNTYTEQTFTTDPETTTKLPPGLYEVRDTSLYCKPAKINNVGVFTTFSDTWKYVCAFPMNSCCILD